ncbi:hypothetical protein VTN77DRAFT_4552 [Rasamsonia byssochlamydoides]|uniref:uncharacterized protein n=1 Tax=Rasamsonia byssochlamydoides TaxID=89139 RepID=UPI0037440FCC
MLIHTHVYSTYPQTRISALLYVIIIKIGKRKRRDKRRPRREENSTEDDPDEFFSARYHRKEEPRREDIPDPDRRDYPNKLLKELEEVYCNRQKSNSTSSAPAKRLSSSSAAAAAPHEVFIVTHERLYTYDDKESDVIGTDARLETANEQVLKIFKEAHEEFLYEVRTGDGDESYGDRGEGFVKIRPGQEYYVRDDEVGWCIDEDGALLLLAKDGRDGDFYKVYTLTQEVQA